MAIAPDDATQSGSPQGRPVLGAALAAREALSGCEPERLWALFDGEVREAMVALGQVAAAANAAMVAVLAEADTRGLGRGQGWGLVDWAASAAPLMPARGLLDLQTVAGAARERRLGAVLAAVRDGADPATAQEALPVAKAAQIVRFHTGVQGMADPDELEETTAVLLAGARGPDGLTERQLGVAVRHAGNVMRPDRLVEHDADVRRANRSLVKGAGPMGMWRYTLLLDEEGAAIVDAAVDALAKPKPDADTGEHDPRSPAARRADALLDLVTRAVSAPVGVPRQAKSSLVVTMGWDALAGRCRGAGLSPGDELLTAETVRRLACDAQVIPMVLGTSGEILDQGRARRLFSGAQIRHLWLRDRGRNLGSHATPWLSAVLVSMSSSISAGVRNPWRLRGRELSSAAMLSSIPGP